MVILKKLFGGQGKIAEYTINEANEFARKKRVIADQTHFVEGWLYIISFYEEKD